MTLKRLATFLLLSSLSAPALAADCDVNVFAAYNTAKLRGWTFSCSASPGLSGSFITYPPPMSSIGCTYKTPPLVAGLSELGTGTLFRRGGSTRPTLMNGWSVKSYEISGGMWTNWAVPGGAPEQVRVAFRAKQTPQPNKTYNYYISKLTLTRGGGSCANAIDQAF